MFFKLYRKGSIRGIIKFMVRERREITRLLYVFCVVYFLNSYGMKSDDFFSIVSNYGTSKELHTKLSAIRSANKEADFFVQKFYEDKNPPKKILVRKS